jgi:alpha-glucosidase
LPSKVALADGALPHGAHPLEDRDEVHEIYAEWRRVFNEYNPPRSAVAEAWVHASRRARYVSPDGLGQAFNFDFLRANWNRDDFAGIITDSLAEARQSGASTTWVLSNHDVVRHATRYGLPQTNGGKSQDGKDWLLGNGATPELDRSLGIRRARAATLLTLALPGSAYPYQGEELGLHEVGDLADDVLQDPVHRRSGGSEKGRDGCRVPLPWNVEGPSFGFGERAAHLPQPTWFGSCSVEAQESDPDSTLHFYRRALGLRTKLQEAGELAWLESTTDSVLHFSRPGGWRSVTNFGSQPVALPTGSVVIASGAMDGDRLPPDTTAWLLDSVRATAAKTDRVGTASARADIGCPGPASRRRRTGRVSRQPLSSFLGPWRRWSGAGPGDTEERADLLSRLVAWDTWSSSKA